MAAKKKAAGRKGSTPKKTDGPDNNLQAYELFVEALPEAPDPARYMLGRTLAAELDLGVMAATAKVYKEVLDALGDADSEEVDVFDQYELKAVK